jgi:hypothetical protein
MDHIAPKNVPLNVGVVQTAYANGASTGYCERVFSQQDDLSGSEGDADYPTTAGESAIENMLNRGLAQSNANAETTLLTDKDAAPASPGSRSGSKPGLKLQLNGVSPTNDASVIGSGNKFDPTPRTITMGELSPRGESEEDYCYLGFEQLLNKY